MVVLKFGGTSVGTVESIKSVINIVQKTATKKEPVIVVFSAFGGVTNRLIELGNLAAAGDMDFLEQLASLEDRHFNSIRKLTSVKQQSAILAKIKGLFNDLEDLLRGISLIKEASARSMDLLIGFGERLSTSILTEVLKEYLLEVQMLDTREVIKTNSTFGNAQVQYAETNNLIQEWFYSNTKQITCATGFIASDLKGVSTTLGRGGSDFTASILAAALNASEVQIWTDVNGMMTADPRKVPKAFSIPAISYAEAMELSHFGAKVIYPPSLTPAFQKNIPILVKNTFEPEHEGTRISSSVPPKKWGITGISSIDDITLVNLIGNGMIGVAGISARLFSVLASNEISVILISQASSEHSICFAIKPNNAERVKELLLQEFQMEISRNHIENVHIQENLSIIAVVGEGMKSSSGTSGKLFGVLGQNGVNVIAVAQGSSELNISVVIEKKNISKALNAIHERFFQQDGTTLNLFLVGPTGLIGTTLLNQIKQQKEYLKESKNLNLKIVGLSNTKKMLIDPNGVDVNHWEQKLEESGEKSYLPTFIDEIQALNLPYSVFIDNTADKNMVQFYPLLLNQHISIVTPNKVANSGSYASYAELQQLARTRNCFFLYETNVGAGLPIINTLKGLIDAGDRIHKIEAVLSGTLAYLFNTYDGTCKFVEVVKDAKAKGFTEPDPREDLSGMDVARKILILARETGIAMEPEDIELSPLLNEDCIHAPNVETFYQKLSEDDKSFLDLVTKAKEQNRRLRYIASLEDEKAKVSLQEVEENHPFYNLSGSENIISFTTERYKNYPLVVKGPGAGAEVTAMGVFADIISLSSTFK